MTIRGHSQEIGKKFELQNICYMHKIYNSVYYVYIYVCVYCLCFCVYLYLFVYKYLFCNSLDTNFARQGINMNRKGLKTVYGDGEIDSGGNIIMS